MKDQKGKLEEFFTHVSISLSTHFFFLFQSHQFVEWKLIYEDDPYIC